MSQLDIGSRICELRQNRKMTQGELAGRIGVTPQALSKWERNQSVPDLYILVDLCRMLGVSADYLLGTKDVQITENGDGALQEEIWETLRNCLEPLELVFGEKFVPVFTDSSFMDKIAGYRKELARDGILMPLVRVRDELKLQPGEFRILSENRVLYSEQAEEGRTDSCDYIIGKLADVVREQYGEILNPDIIKGLVDNLKVRYPARIQGVVPERISYGLLTDLMKEFVRRGNSMRYLIKVIGFLNSCLYDNPEAGKEELTGMLMQKAEEFAG